MPAWMAVLTALGGSVLTAVSVVFGPVLLEKVRHKNKREDDIVSQIDDVQELRKELTEFRKYQEDQNGEMRARIGGLETTLDMQSAIISAGEYIAMRREALAHIKAGSIDIEDKVILKDRHRRYRALSKDRSLDDIMLAVDGLRHKIPDE